jgi:hypothetical protein
MIHAATNVKTSVTIAIMAAFTISATPFIARQVHMLHGSSTMTVSMVSVIAVDAAIHPSIAVAQHATIVSTTIIIPIPVAVMMQIVRNLIPACSWRRLRVLGPCLILRHVVQR